MKKIILIVFITVITNKIMAQEQVKGIKLHSIQLGAGGFSNKNYEGVDFYASLAIKSRSNLFSVLFNAGGTFDILSSKSSNFAAYNAMYGKELKIANWISFEGFGGVGYFKQKSSASFVTDANVFSIPFALNTKIYISKNSGLGINTNYLINKLNNNLSLNLILHYRFK